MDQIVIENNYIPIKEFADLVGMTPSALRHYHKKGIFLPAKIGDKISTSNRYYSTQQITTVKMIRILADIGVPLKTIKELVERRNPEILLEHLNKHKDIVTGKLRFLKGVYSIIGTFTELLNNGISAIEDEIYVSEVPETKIILGSVNDYKDSTSYHKQFTRFCSSQCEPELNLSYPIGGYWESMDALMKEPACPMRFFSLDPKGLQKKEQGLYLIGYTRGYYGQVKDLPKRLMSYAKKNSLVFNGPVYKIYLFDEMSIADPENYLMQISASVRALRSISSRRSHHKLL
jgi:DNA-binding transcriptional MerR regulator